MLTFAEIWERIVERPAAEFLVTPDMRLDYGGFAELLRRFSSTFDRSGLATGDRVLILTRNEPLAIAAFAAALLDGLVPVIMAPHPPSAWQALRLRLRRVWRCWMMNAALKAGGVT